jgi:three-Cys-motif partner protein
MPRRSYRSSVDGLRVRRNGSWGETKLSFLDRYFGPALLATRKKWDRVYVDLFAGPGRNQTGTGGEYDGSALRALRAHAPSSDGLHFTRAVLVNAGVRDHEALRHRVDHLLATGECRLPRGQIELRLDDANDALPDILSRIHPQSYAFVFADPTAPSQLPWRTIEALSPAHRPSIDLYLLFPLSMGVVRLCSWAQVQDPAHLRVLDNLYGSQDWRQIRRTTSGQAWRFRHALLEHYLEQLRQRWRHVSVVRDINRRHHQGLYKMIFCTNNPAGQAIAQWEVRHQQLPLAL